MGKYMKKAKISAEIALMEITPFGGVRTRAKTLAILRLQAAGGESPAASSASSSSCYLQLRSRRLEKLVPVARPRESAKPNPRHSANHSSNPNPSPSPTSSMRSQGMKKDEEVVEVEGEASFGENILELEGKSTSGRNTRETTPCNLIRDSDTIRMPGSSSRPNSTTTRTTRRVQSSIQINIPTSHEMDEFFSGPEKVQQKAFAEKYNFDPVMDHPLPGRYEWVKLEC